MDNLDKELRKDFLGVTTELKFEEWVGLDEDGKEVLYR